MRAKPEYRDRDDTEVAVLDALADRRDEGMTVFELRSRTEENIDRIEDALAALKADGLIEVEDNGEPIVHPPGEGVVGEAKPDEDVSIVDYIRNCLPQ